MLIHLLQQLNALRIVLASSSPRRQQMLSQLGLKFSVRVSTFAEDLSKTGRTPAQYVVDTGRHKALDVFAALRADAKASAKGSGKDEPVGVAAAAAGATGGVDVVISADTVVVLDEQQILEKPRDRAHAIQMISALSGRSHAVYTGVTLLFAPHVIPAAMRKARWHAQRQAHTQAHATAAAADAKAAASATAACDAADASDASDAFDESAPFVESFYERSEVTFAALSRAEVEAYVATGEPMDKAGGYGIQGVGGALVRGVNGCFLNVVGFPLHAFAQRLAATFADAGVAAGALTVTATATATAPAGMSAAAWSVAKAAALARAASAPADNSAANTPGAMCALTAAVASAGACTTAGTGPAK